MSVRRQKVTRDAQKKICNAPPGVNKCKRGHGSSSREIYKIFGWRSFGREGAEKSRGSDAGKREARRGGREVTGAGRSGAVDCINALRALHPENFRRNINCDRSRLGILLQQEFSPKQSVGSKDSSPASEASGRACR